MKAELEAKFLEVDKVAMRAKLLGIGAVCIHPERIMQRVVFENEHMNNKRAWLRVRNEGNVTKLTIKQSSDAQDISRIKEAEVVVGDFETTKNILVEIGLEQKRYQENYRESWKYKDVSIEIDSWPLIPPYLEIEGNSEEEVKEISNLLDFNYDNAVFGSADEVYKSKYGIDILTMDRLVFDN